MPKYELFKKGLLEKYDMSDKDVLTWKYSGGDSGRHLNYWKLKFKNTKTPDHESHCVCGHYIVQNCYITNDKNTELLVLGNCCIKAFIPTSARNCSICGNEHKNRIVDRCNKCRVGKCDVCDVKCNPQYKKCFDCFKNKKPYKHIAI